MALASLSMSGVLATPRNHVTLVRPCERSLRARLPRRTGLLHAAASSPHKDTSPVNASTSVEPKASSGPLHAAQQFFKEKFVKAMGAVALACLMVR
jgi:hypothetical protein